MLNINGRFWLDKDGEVYLGGGRVELLKMIDKHGSMHKAAKEMKMSYKAAWDRVNSMNSQATFPLTQKTTGGKGGGGTVLTDYAFEQIKLFERFDTLHREFMDRFAAAGDDPEKLAGIMSRSFLSTSARNQIPCKVKSVTIHEPYATLKLETTDNVELFATITKRSMNDMNIEEQSSVYAIIKSSDIQITHVPHARMNRVKQTNDISGDIITMQGYNDNVELVVGIAEYTQLIAVVNKKDISKLGVTDRAYISISYENILIGV